MADEQDNQLPEVDSRVVDEAFRRGANVDEALGLLITRRTVGGGTRQISGAVPGYGDADARTVALVATPDETTVPGSTLRPLVTDAYARYVALVSDEFLSLDPFVMSSFTPLKGEPFGSAQAKYLAMRAVYHRGGWRCPKEAIFDHIVRATFFGRPVTGGVHRLMLPLLGRVEQRVRANAEATRVMTRETFSIGGFVPRYIGGETVLSNHAYGLALDIDPDWNPMVKGAKAIAAFRQATGEAFGEWLFAASSVDAVAQTYKKVAAASKKLKAWLRRMLPAYDDEQIMRADLARAKGKAAQEAAAAKRRDLDARLKSDPDRRALADLIALYQLPVVRQWEDRGIVTIPAAVVAAWLESHPDARWGGGYQHSKDMMHVELMAERTLRGARSAPVAGLGDLVGRDPSPRPACRPVDWSTP